MIPREKVEEIIQSARIEEVVGEYVNLKKRGANMLGLCPFHNEKTPSFTVSPAKGIYKCFGCGKAGDSVRFIMDHDQLSYPEALKHLAAKYNIEVEEVKLSDEALQEQNERESILITLKFAGEYYSQQLWNDEEGKDIGLSYFEERGFRHDTIRKFGLGYSREGWSNFYDFALRSGYQESFLKRAGLCNTNEQGKTFDTFRGRVIFPIQDLSGRIVAFAGRIMKKDPKQPKYVNSPETEVYHKSDVLYGMYLAKQEIRKLDVCYLVEGYTDVITLHQGGVENVVASSGTSLTEKQIKLIRRFTENVVVLYDGDQAGLKASLRGVDMILEQGLNVKVVTFPEGEDPDSYCKSVGGEAFREYIQQKQRDFILFKSGLLLQDAENDPVKKAGVIRDIVESIARIPDSIKRSLFVKECGKLLDVPEQVLMNELNKLLRSKRKDEKEALQKAEEAPLNYEELLQENEIEVRSREPQEKDLLRILIHNGHEMLEEELSVAHFILKEFNEHELSLENPLYQRILEQVGLELQEGRGLSQDYFTRHQDADISSFASATLMNRYELSPRWDEKYASLENEIVLKIKEDLQSILLRLKLKKIDELIQENLEHIKNPADDDQLMQSLQLDQYLKSLRKQLCDEAGIVVIK